MDSKKRTSAVTIYRQTLLLYLDTGSFSFSDTNANKYTFEYVFDSLRTGVSLTDYQHTSFIDYTCRNLTVDSTAPDGSVFKGRVKAYALEQPDAPIYSNEITFTVYNPAGTYLRKYMPGLIDYDVLIDGQTSFVPIKTGFHTLSLKTNPSNYLEETGSTVSFVPTDSTNPNFTVEGSTLTVPLLSDAVDASRLELQFSIFCPISGVSDTFNAQFFYDAGHSEDQEYTPSYDEYAFNLYYENRRGGYFGPGSYLLKPVFRYKTHPDVSNYEMKMTPSTYTPSNLSFADTISITEGVTVTIPDGFVPAYASYEMTAVIYDPNDPTRSYTSGLFFFGFSKYANFS